MLKSFVDFNRMDKLLNETMQEVSKLTGNTNQEEQ